MHLQEYEHKVMEYVFSKWIDIPLEFEYMVEIVASQFYHTKIDVDLCCKFADLMIDIKTKNEFLSLTYEPFKVLEDEITEAFKYTYDPNVDFENFYLDVEDEKISINYKRGLDYSTLKHLFNSFE